MSRAPLRRPNGAWRPRSGKRRERMTLLLILIVYATALAAGLAVAGLRSAIPIPAAPSRSPVTRVLIVGATGGTGRQLLAQALERGLEVTALVRNPAKLSVQHPRLKVIQGDVLDSAT